jgi:hypothetical protein
MQVGRPGTAGTVHPFDYLGCKVATARSRSRSTTTRRLALNLDAQNEKDDQTLATPSYPATQTLLHDGMLTVTVNGSTASARWQSSCRSTGSSTSTGSSSAPRR